MLNRILEISKKQNRAGRVSIKIAILKIHEDPKETNLNGLHWDIKCVEENMKSAISMPICCEFADEEKSTPLGHGLTGEEINGDGIKEAVFLDSETVGVIEKVSIEDIEIDGVMTKVLLGEGVIFAQRYPALVKWIRTNLALGQVSTSVEIVGIPENDNRIQYLEENPTEDFRTPSIFLFSGTAILSVQPSDSSAVVVEISQKSKQEDYKLTEQEIMSAVEKAIAETNSVKADTTEKITELNSLIAEKDAKIEELNASVAEMQKLLDDMKTEQETSWAERDILEHEIAKAKIAEKLAELDAAVGEFNEAEKEVAKEDIDKLKEEISSCEKKEELESKTSEINSIKSKICMAIVEKQKKAEAEARLAEINAAKETKIEDIFSDIAEVNNASDDFDLLA